MKVASIRIQNFKQFDDLEISFKNEILDEVSDRYLILGDNGSGKTTLLQAIALPLALATGKIRDVTEFDWLGFLPGRYLSQQKTPTIEMEVRFSQEEIAATDEIYKHWFNNQSAQFQQENPYSQPPYSESVFIVLSREYLRVGNTSNEHVQFYGRSYVQWLINRNQRSFRNYFSRLPGVFWFDQFRNSGNPPGNKKNGNGKTENRQDISFAVGVERLRSRLINWYLQQEQGRVSNEENYLLQLKRLYQIIFPNRSFFGLEHLPKLNSPIEEEIYFLLNDGHRNYDIAEMSAGEQAVFPILYEFVQQQISNSVVLIDEIDLNLHPPAAQYLTSQLLRIAPTCQFIFTTHSADVSNVIGEHETYRIKGGSLCL